MDYLEMDMHPDVRPLPLVGLPPPPPPPPPPPFPDPTTDITSPKGPFPRFSPNKQHDIAHLEDRYEGVRDARLNLKGSRFRLQLERRKLHGIRQELGEKEGSVLLQLRRFLKEGGSTLPGHIHEAIQEVDNLRDLLGSREADYEAAEHSFDLQETKYETREAEFIDNLLDNYDINVVELNAPESSQMARNRLGSQVTEHNISQNEHSRELETKTGVKYWLLDLLENLPLQKAYLHTAYPPSSSGEYLYGQDTSENAQIVSTVGAQFQHEDLESRDEELSGCFSMEVINPDNLERTEPQQVPAYYQPASNSSRELPSPDDPVFLGPSERSDQALVDADFSRCSSSAWAAADKDNKVTTHRKSRSSRHNLVNLINLSYWIKREPPFPWIGNPFRRRR